jgi:hypothetical protein
MMADDDSLDGEIALLRALIQALAGQVSATTGDDRTRFALIRQIRELVDSVSRAYRASHAGSASQRDKPTDARFVEMSEERRTRGDSHGASDRPPAPPADAGA